ncbi:MAG TPA: type III secretion T3S chaperone [Chlamydiales bacterium]|nr:type III secretion T3S chaperone [Chlamydiales bacterium]
MTRLNYPLEQMLIIKKNRFEAAIKTLEEKKAILEKAYEKLYDITQARDEVLQHKNAKLEQLRHELDTGTTTDKIHRSKTYLKIVDEKLVEHEKKVVEQQKQVDASQKQVDIATDDLFQKKKDLEKLELHKKEWEKEMEYWVRQKEEAEQDEQGAATHLLRQREELLRKKNREKKENSSS